MKANGAASTDPGNVRATNEDFFVAESDLGVYVVCDGVSGNKGGDVASRMCAETIRDYIRENRGVIDRYRADRNPQTRTQITHLVQKAIQVANTKVHSHPETDPSKKGMATTVEVIIVTEDYAILGHVGDSRCYVVRGNKVHQLTQDHKVGAEMVKQGTWTRDEAAKSPYANVLTRAIGQDKFVQPDMLQLELMANDLFVLCSDGLADYLMGRELLDYAGQEDCSTISKELVKFAKDKGGKDNVTVAAVRVGGDGDGDGKVNQALDIMKRSELVGKVPLFRYLGYTELMKILNLVTVRDVKAGEALIEEGAVGHEMFIVVSGNVEVRKGGQRLAKISKGAFFGEMCFFDDAPRSATISAAEITKVLVLAKQDFLPLLRKESQIAVKFLWAVNQELNQRLRVANKEVATLKASLSTPVVPFQLPDQH